MYNYDGGLKTDSNRCINLVDLGEGKAGFLPKTNRYCCQVSSGLRGPSPTHSQLHGRRFQKKKDSTAAGSSSSRGASDLFTPDAGEGPLLTSEGEARHGRKRAIRLAGQIFVDLLSPTCPDP